MKFLMKLFSLLLAGLFPFWICAQLPNAGLVVDLNPGTNSGSASNFMKLGSTMIFSASNGSTGTELWKTDGTAAGTVLIKDIRPGTSSSSISNMRLMGSFVYFTANDGTNGGALWRTDGTTVGTTMVKDLNAATTSTSNITELTVIGNRLYFRGDDGVNGTEPWISDGSTNGTVMLKNIAPGSGSSSGFNCLSCAGTFEFVEFGGFVYFNANDLSNSGQQNSELWRTDGTTGGTVLFKDNYSLGGSGPANLVNAGSFLFFTSDNQSTTGYEPWKTDGTVGGTVMIKDIFTTANVGSITGDVSTAYMNGYVYFIAIDVYYPANFNLNPPQSGYINAELWRTDGTSGGTTKVKEINPGTTGITADAFPFSTTNFLVFNNKLYFNATDGTNGMELWVSDGTSANTIMLKNIDTAGDGSPSNLYAHNGFVYFSADDNATNGREVWRTDGTPAGTVLVKDINTGNSNGNPSNFTSLDANHLLFGATRSIYGSELHILGGNTVAVTTSANGTVSPPGAVSTGNTVDMGFKSGTSQTFTFAPGGGFNTQSVVVDGSSVGTPGSYQFNNITANHTLNVTFGTGAPTTFTINASAGVGGSISPSGAVSVNSGGSQTFTITPSSGFCIQSVLVNSVNQGAISSYTFNNVTSNQTISVTFVAAIIYYRDLDTDGFGNSANTTTSCTGAPSGYVVNSTDCNDNSAVEKPGQIWYKDTDGDNYAQTGAATITQCARPVGGYKAASELTSTTGDCNDNNPAIKPGATEVCDGVDNNCNGATDEGGLTTYFQDSDMDGFGNPSATQQACTQPSGYVTNNTDCNDNSAVEKPGQIWYKDTDSDGYAQTGAAMITQCSRPVGYRAASELISTTGDCDDNNFNIKPSATEACDGIDNNCNGITDEGAQILFYRDFDTDGFGNPSSVISSCTQPVGYVADNTDCNDNSAVEKPGQIWYKDTDGDGYAQTGAPTITQCSRPVGSYKAASELTSTTGDCNDNNGSINPAATEVCDGVDNNCNGSTDEGTLTTYYQDSDMDGFGNPSATQQACSQPVGYVTNNTDCNDNSALEKPGQIWYKDTDGDSYAQTGAATITQCLRPVGYKAASELTSTTGDCNDNNAAINPVATEVCDGIDNNCNGSTDEGVLTTYYQDSDMDGFGNPSATQQACSQPGGYVTNNTDCNDNSALEKPGQIWYKDTDGDNYAQTGAPTITQCARPVGYKAASELTSTTGDCNDNNAAINPAATEVCDGIDNNCNGSTDEGVLTTYYQDSDMDGFGNPSATQQACSQPVGYVTNNTDCNDNSAVEKPGQIWYKDTDGDSYAQTGAATITQCLRPVGYKAASELASTTGDCNDNNAAINPAAPEVCDGIDNNCNGSTDEGVLTTYYQDSDTDGFGNPSVSQQACSQPVGYVTNNTDCNDNESAINPNTVWYLDADNDNYYTGSGITQCTSPGAGYKYTGLSGGGDCNDNDNTVYPGATDVCDGKDNDCDGSTDEGGTGPAPGWGVGTIGGATNATSNFTCNSGTPTGTAFNITSQGFSGAANADLINSNYQQRCGDASITAHIASSPAPGWAGIYIRENLSAGSKMVAIKTNLSSFLRREVRATVNGNKTTAQNPLYANNTWVRIVRTSNTFAFYTSPDGATWTITGSTTVAMGSCVYIGLFAESINAATTVNASFDNVAITGGAAPLVTAPGQGFEAQEEYSPVMEQINVYPNPSTGQIQIGFRDFSGKAIRIKVSNSFGSTVLTTKLEEALDTESLDLSAFAPGVYWLQVQTEGYAPQVQKLVLSR